MPFVESAKGIIVILLNLVTTGTGLGVALPITSTNPRVHIRGAGVITGGNIIIEEAIVPDYAGTWSQIYTIAALGFSGGVEQVVHIYGTIGAIRARISSDIIGGGTITVELVSD